MIGEIGKVFGYLTLIEKVKFENNHYKWRCKCRCGNEINVLIGHLNAGYIKSCGCLRKERMKTVSKLYGLPKDEAAKRKLFREYKANAKKCKRDFELSYDEFLNLTKQNCHYCGICPFQKKENKHIANGEGDYVYNGIDRIDSSKGYVKGNVVTCCFACNGMKSNKDHKFFIHHLYQISEHLSKTDSYFKFLKNTKSVVVNGIGN